MDKKIRGGAKMGRFGQFYLDKEKDIIVDLSLEGDRMEYTLSTPNHKTGNLIRNLAALCGLPISTDSSGLAVIRGKVPCYINADNRPVYIFRLRDTKVANIFADGTVERKASIPAISKTLMSQTKDYHLDFARTVVKTYIPAECKFRADLHTHMNANLDGDLLIALGIFHHIAYPLYYIKKLGLRVNARQSALLDKRRAVSARRFADSSLTGKYLTRRIDDNTFIDFADLLLGNPGDAPWNISHIRASLAVMKDGQAVFTNLEKVYLYRYVFTRGIPSEEVYTAGAADALPDKDIAAALRRMEEDHRGAYRGNTLFMDKLLWIARSYARRGILYAEISDTSLANPDRAAATLAAVHAVMPRVTAETGVTLRFLAAIRRTPLTIVRDSVAEDDALRRSLSVLRAVASDPYVAGSDIIGEEINDIRELRDVIRELVRLAEEEKGFVIRIHAGENDSLRDNVYNSLMCVRESVSPGREMPRMRIGHGLYTANLSSRKGKQLTTLLRETKVILEFQLTSNVRLNNLSALDHHPLKQYLAAGVRCVQGTDGGALYGTDSIDEQLALAKLLSLTAEDQIRMCEAERQAMEEGLAAFREKTARFPSLTGEGAVEGLYRDRIAHAAALQIPLPGEKRYPSAEALREGVEELPSEGVPLVIVGGSFSSDRRRSAVRREDRELLDAILEGCDPEKVFLVIGPKLRGQEKYLAERAAERLRTYCFVPSLVTAREKKRVLESGLRVRVAIEPSAMGVYKSFAYEIFKRRPSVLVAFDGNSAACNMIQEARNGKYPCAIHVDARSRILRAKARTLEGYVSLFPSPDAAGQILRDIEKAAQR